MTNPYIAQFLEDARARWPVDGAHISYSEWIALNTKLANKPFSYKGYEFQRAIVDDMSPDLSVIKPSQVGLTEVQIRKFLAWLARNPGTSGIFTFPDLKMFKKNSKTRIRPVVSQPAFGQAAFEDDKPQRSMELYQIGSSFAHIMGMTEGDATSTPADILAHDEIDLSDPTMIGLYQSRLQNSVFKITQAFSTPTFPGYGIDARYSASNQFHDMVRCRCGHWQAPRFEMAFLNLPGYTGDGLWEEYDPDQHAKIDFKSACVKCERCSQALDLTDPDIREWVAKHAAREAHGYRVSPFSPTHGRLNVHYILNQLLKMKQLDQYKGWKNTVLGETHSDGNSKLEPDQVKAVMKGPGVPDVSRTMPLALGCDMGRVCHLTLGLVLRNGVDPILFEQVPATRIHERIAELRERYNIVSGCVDRHPYTPDAERIRDESNRVIMPLEYRGASTFTLKEDEYGALDYVQANRTQIIDNQVRAIRNSTTELRGYGALGPIVVEHCCDMVRIETPDKPATWEKLTGQDHFMHSLALMRASVKVRELIALNTPHENRMFFSLVAAPTQSQAPLGKPAKGQPARLI